ncbi:MAG: hypothetical protein LBB18_01520 [Puniceicoccales bacterium]|jgi:hypothetical protein|nr:hypothetical protein [Puniceicoccales bacterium]
MNKGTDDRTTIQEDVNLTLNKIYESMKEPIARKETELNAALEEIRKKGKDVSNAELLAMQAQVSAWTNLVGIVTGVLRAIGDAMRATTQNIR